MNWSEIRWNICTISSYFNGPTIRILNDHLLGIQINPDFRSSVVYGSVSPISAISPGFYFFCLWTCLFIFALVKQKWEHCHKSQTPSLSLYTCNLFIGEVKSSMTMLFLLRPPTKPGYCDVMMHALYFCRGGEVKHSDKSVLPVMKKEWKYCK